MYILSDLIDNNDYNDYNILGHNPCRSLVDHYIRPLYSQGGMYGFQHIAILYSIVIPVLAN